MDGKVFHIFSQAEMVEWKKITLMWDKGMTDFSKIILGEGERIDRGEVKSGDSGNNLKSAISLVCSEE